ncbi:hypothetical protein NQZ79_g4988 [Umbelopsis isabellina]|nr:hypothetical protein NQZ79_g4988 [Umbelopsis isabellina]
MSQPEDAIERTPEYNRFMSELRDFHKNHGTYLQAEPVLGGKKLDLLKIWNRVQEAGGFEQVTQSRTWKQVGDPFNFPVTCTNSAYVLKAVYIKYMLGYEEEKVWGRTWVPPSDALEVNQKPGQTTASPGPPKLPVAYKPTNVVRKTATAFAPQVVSKPYTPQPQMMPHRPPPNVQTRPMMSADHLMYDENFRTRITLALKSRLPNEIDWAFNNLVRLSFVSEDFNLAYMPQLLDNLVSFAEPFFQKYVFPLVGSDSNAGTLAMEAAPVENGATAMEGVEQETANATQEQNQEYSNPSDPALSNDITVEADDHLFNSKEYQEELERVLQVLHILRNASFLESNSRAISQNAKLPSMLIKGLASSCRAQFIELSQHCLDILENIAPTIILQSRLDPYLVALSRLVFTNDKALILGATKALARVAVTEVNEKVFSIPDIDVLKRMIEFLFVNDEELLAATLEYLYQHTSVHSDLATELLNLYPGNIIGLLTGFLYYHSSIVPNGTLANVDMITITEAPAPPPTKGQGIPDLTNYAQLDEPYRCLGWVKDRLQSAGPDGTLVLGDVYRTYQARFGSNKPLGMREFYTVLKIALPQGEKAEDHELNTVVLKNIMWNPNSSGLDSPCLWQDCKSLFATDKELHRHILETHVPKSDESTGYTCKWMSCTRFSTPINNRHTILCHLRIHFAEKPQNISKQKRVQVTSNNAIPVDDTEISGVPLTAALLLRNLVKDKRHHAYFLPFEQDIIMTGIQRPKLERYTVAVTTALQS